MDHFGGLSLLGCRFGDFPSFGWRGRRRRRSDRLQWLFKHTRSPETIVVQRFSFSSQPGFLYSLCSLETRSSSVLPAPGRWITYIEACISWNYFCSLVTVQRELGVRTVQKILWYLGDDTVTTTNTLSFIASVEIFGIFIWIDFTHATISNTSVSKHVASSLFEESKMSTFISWWERRITSVGLVIGERLSVAVDNNVEIRMSQVRFYLIYDSGVVHDWLYYLRKNRCRTLHRRSKWTCGGGGGSLFHSSVTSFIGWFRTKIYWSHIKQPHKDTETTSDEPSPYLWHV